ncbi:MAG: hypothetical protein Q7R98_01055 [Candidatus Jorgensenbacteria bacterium]|nr:hypothetical protein [Candidatus Jorgensenbacteria bacterium]
MKFNPNDLEGFILEGINIGKQTVVVENCTQLSGLRRRYLDWIYQIKEFLEKEKVSFSEESFFYEEDEVMGTINRGCGINIQDEFAQQLIKNIRLEVRNKLRYLRNTAKKLKKTNQNIIFLDTAGNLWREPRKSYCYPLGEKSERFSIIKLLAENKGYLKTKDISLALNGKSEQSIRTEIGKIRKNISRYLKINSKGIIEAKKESGYRISPDYKIVLKKD